MDEHAFVSIKGGSYVTFKRAVAAGQALPALSAAYELGRLNLADALALTCVLRDDPRHFEGAVVRWHSRFVQEVRGVGVADAALGSFRSSFGAGAAALAAVCDRYERADLADLAEVLDRALGQA
jgi:hypothetical protein